MTQGAAYNAETGSVTAAENLPVLGEAENHMITPPMQQPSEPRKTPVRTETFDGGHTHRQELIRDVVIGMADGLTVPFALAAGLAGTLSTTALIITAGLAEIAAGCIAMGLGGYLAVKSDHEFFVAQRSRKRQRVNEFAQEERSRLEALLTGWGLSDSQAQSAAASITNDPQQWLDFTMKYDLGLEQPRPERARNSSLTIGASYAVGGLVPLLPYMLLHDPKIALLISALVTLVALFFFGLGKGKFLGTRPLRSAIQTMVVGGLAAAVAYAAAQWIA